jgi:hypothetical protein
VAAASTPNAGPRLVGDGPPRQGPAGRGHGASEPPRVHRRLGSLSPAIGLGSSLRW